MFKKYYTEAEQVISDTDVLNAMCLSTVDGRGQPHSRMVLLKGLKENQFVFYTNFKSNKALELEENPRVSLLFHWRETGRQVRIEGVAQKGPRKMAEDYWNSRPFESQVSGYVSDQSHSLPLHEELVKKFESARGKLTQILCPEHWGGYLIEPSAFEFWKASPVRLHKRVHFKRVATGWDSQRLQP